MQAQIATRSRSERVSMSEWTRTLRKELERPTIETWLREMGDREEPVLDASAVIDILVSTRRRQVALRSHC